MRREELKKRYDSMIPSEKKIVRFFKEHSGWHPVKDVSSYFGVYFVDKSVHPPIRPRDKVWSRVENLHKKGVLEKRTKAKKSGRNKFEYALSSKLKNSTLKSFMNSSSVEVGSEKIKELVEMCKKKEGRTDVIEELRNIMGTLPSRKPKKSTTFYYGAKDIYVKLLDGPINPYKAIFAMVTATWGDSNPERIDKWEETSPEGRFLVVYAALSRQTLPHCLEAPKFTFAVGGPTRASFDQFARQRIGSAFGARGSRDNNWLDAGYRIPYGILRLGEHETAKIKAFFLTEKDFYEDIIAKKKANWQVGRTVLSQHLVYKWVATYNYAALQNLAATRLTFCEQEDTVATAWLIWKEMWKKYPLLAAFMRPKCDWAGMCLYQKAYSLSELFGCLFKPCGRNPYKGDYEYAEFNEACTSRDELQADIGVKIPEPDQWDDLVIEAVKMEWNKFKED